MFINDDIVYVGYIMILFMSIMIIFINNDIVCVNNDNVY